MTHQELGRQNGLYLATSNFLMNLNLRSPPLIPRDEGRQIDPVYVSNQFIRSGWIERLSEPRFLDAAMKTRVRD